jgi:P22_AR N-terminal domain
LLLLRRKESSMSDVRLAQVTIPDCLEPVQAVQMPDGLVGATLRSLCAALSLDYASQYQRIRRTAALREALQLITLDTPGGPQAVDVIPAWVIPVWLAGLHINRLPEEKRALILSFQREAVAAIERAFTEPESSAPPPQERKPETSPNVVDQMKQGFSLLSESFITLAIDQQSLQERVTALEGGPAQPIIGNSSQRLLQLYVLARRVRARLGYRVSDTLVGLADHFHVEDVSDLPETAWPGVLEWFETLLVD